MNKYTNRKHVKLTPTNSEKIKSKTAIFEEWEYLSKDLSLPKRNIHSDKFNIENAYR